MLPILSLLWCIYQSRAILPSLNGPWIGILFSSTFISYASTTCFYPNGTESPGDLPCDPSASSSACCGTGWTYALNRVCQDLSSDRIIRATYTDQKWLSREYPGFYISGKFDFFNPYYSRMLLIHSIQYSSYLGNWPVVQIIYGAVKEQKIIELTVIPSKTALSTSNTGISLFHHRQLNTKVRSNHRLPPYQIQLPWQHHQQPPNAHPGAGLTTKSSLESACPSAVSF